MAFPGTGIRSEPTMLQLWQCWILNLLCWARDRTCVPCSRDTTDPVVPQRELTSLEVLIGFFLFFFFCLFAFSRAAPAAYEGSQARGQIRAVATGLRQRHSMNPIFCLCKMILNMIEVEEYRN